ncbi:hypothetical protein [Nocardioides sp. Soil796]|uniref:hypothetical protein n=1 Tax=Nocardioides sp. Soil796 TaxID=1736412 RepID=UPI00070B5547|nr:hypothetical protein [Nocardioides sp. Soil796]KRF19662.1 hypothetical protein ASH02_24210 [Nocardioides sp. Soil796]
MAKSIGVKVEGLSGVVRNLQKMGVEVEDLKDAFARIGEQVKPDYQRVTPVRSGRLRGDYRVSKAKGKVNLYVGRASIPYAGPINYGWAARNIAPANFIAKGDETASPKASNSLEEAISDLVEKLNLG